MSKEISVNRIIVVALLMSCAPMLPIANAPCPCAEGWVCCEDQNFCATDLAYCRLIARADGGGMDAGQSGNSNPDGGGMEAGQSGNSNPDGGGVDAGQSGNGNPDGGAQGLDCVSTPLASTPLASQVTPCNDEATFRKLIVGQWIQYEGQCLIAEHVGIEFTADGIAYDLTRVADGSVQRLASPTPWTVTVDANGVPKHLVFNNGGGTDDAPMFFDSGQKMHALLWPFFTNYKRL